jgi:predicted transcriptional regulator
MVEPALKQQILEVIDQLPPDATLEDAIERLCFLVKIDRGLAQSEAGELVPHSEVVKRYAP